MINENTLRSADWRTSSYSTSGNQCVEVAPLPAGQVAMATHRGNWDVGPAHRAVIDECERLGLERVGPRWEIYGHFNAPGDEEVEIYYLIR